MYATNRLLGFESYSKSSFGAQTAQVSVKPTREVQKLLDAANLIGENYRRPALEKALGAAVAVKDYPGIDACIGYLRTWFFFKGDESTGNDFFQKLLVRAQRNRDYRLESLVLIGLSYFQDKDADKAEALLNRAVGLARRYGTDFEKVQSLMGMSILYGLLDDTEKSDELLDEALLYARRSSNYGAQSVILTDRVQKFRHKGNIEGAVSLNEEVIRITKGKVGRDVEQEFEGALIMRAKLAEIQGNKTVELQTYIDLLEWGKSKGMDSGYSYYWMNKIAQIHQYNGDFLKYIAVRSEILSMWQKTGFKWKIAQAIAELCIAYDDYGDIKNSIPLLLEAVELSQAIGASRISSSLANVYQKGIKFYETTLEKCRVGLHPLVSTIFILTFRL